MLKAPLSFLFAYFSSCRVKIGIIDAQRLKEGIEAYQIIAKEQKKYEDVWKVKFMAEKTVLEKEVKDYEKQKISIINGCFISFCRRLWKS